MQVREVTSGPFRPLLQEPAVQAVLGALGSTGFLTALEALLL
jgi:hypothetical protein